MRRVLYAALFVVVSALLAEPAAAQAGAAKASGESVTITASVVDLSCKFVQDQSGEAHRACAQACADKGQPLGLLTADGQFYVPVNSGMGAAGENARLKAFAEQNVKVTGKVIERGGVKTIVIENITKA